MELLHYLQVIFCVLAQSKFCGTEAHNIVRVTYGNSAVLLRFKFDYGHGEIQSEGVVHDLSRRLKLSVIRY